jgi:hypothetical protein
MPGPDTTGMSNENHPEWCTQQHSPDDTLRYCAGEPRGIFTPSGASAWARPVQVNLSDPARSESYILVNGSRSLLEGNPDLPFSMRVPAADAGPLISLITVLSGADREQFRELAAGISTAQAAVGENEPEAG